MKHRWQTYGEDIDIFAYMVGEYHNGPRCVTCGFGFCHHCNPGGYETACGTPTIPADDANLVDPAF